MADFYTIITEVGKAKLANSQVTGKKVDISEMAVGDGGGSSYNPVDSQTDLRHEVWRGNIGMIDVDPDNPNWLVIETTIPVDAGGFNVREAGIFDKAGDLIAIGKYPETYKPVLKEGSGKDLYIRMIIEVTNADSVTLKVDPAVTIASRKYVDEHKNDTSNPHGVTAGQAGAEPSFAKNTAFNKSFGTTQGTVAEGDHTHNDKVDKVQGKGLSTNDYTDVEQQKLSGIEQNANNYNHPDTHPASMITESKTEKFVSQTEKDEWNAKETPAGAQEKADKALAEAKKYADKGNLHVGNIESLSIEQKPGTTLELKWSDPSDLTTKDEGGQIVTLAEWAGTQVRRKAGSYPADENDGDLVADVTKRDKHKSNALTDKGLTAGNEYFYMLLPYTTDDVYTVDPANRIKATAVDKLDQSAPSKPSVSDIKYDKATVTGDSGSKVSLDKSTWYDSPHTFTGLAEETSYTAYAKFPEDKTYFESPVSSGNSFTTPSEAPGPGDIVNGDKQAGFFGEVPASNLFTGSEIASATGITQGTLHNDNIAWIKYTYNGKTCFRPLKSIRYGISYDEIANNGCADGTTTVTKNGVTFKVRLMSGATKDPASDSGDRDAPGSEWNQIMLPISEKAIGGTWEYSSYVGNSVPVWNHNFGTGQNSMYSDSDLGFVSGDGYRHWCQEESQGGTSNRVYRGNSDGPSYAHWLSSDITYSYMGWAPVLELL